MLKYIGDWNLWIVRNCLGHLLLFSLCLRSQSFGDKSRVMNFLIHYWAFNLFGEIDFVWNTPVLLTMWVCLVSSWVVITLLVHIFLFWQFVFVLCGLHSIFRAFDLVCEDKNFVWDPALGIEGLAWGLLRPTSHV